MILPSWQTEISQSQVQDALYITGAPIETGFSLLYSSSINITNTAYNTQLCLMYHNLAMGVNDAQNAKTAIYDNYNNGTNMNLGNWASYNNNPNMIMTWTITNNNTENDLNGNLYIVDNTTLTFYPFYMFTAFNSGGTDNQTNYDTGIAVSTINDDYYIFIDIRANYIGPPPPPGGGINGNTTAATDTDNVGGGTARAAIAVPNFDQNNPIVNQIIVAQTSPILTGIPVNKRTSFDIVFN